MLLPLCFIVRIVFFGVKPHMEHIGHTFQFKPHLIRAASSMFPSWLVTYCRTSCGVCSTISFFLPLFHNDQISSTQCCHELLSFCYDYCSKLMLCFSFPDNGLNSALFVHWWSITNVWGLCRTAKIYILLRLHTTTVFTNQVSSKGQFGWSGFYLVKFVG